MSGTRNLLALYELAKAAGSFWRGRPWEHWHSDQPVEVAIVGPEAHTYEASILGNGGDEFGLALYPKKGSTTCCPSFVVGQPVTAPTVQYDGVTS